MADGIYQSADSSIPKMSKNLENASQERPSVFVDEALEQQASKYIEEQQKQLDTLLQDPEPKENSEN